jgi:anti-sigma factor (TIGR02949 family)
MTMSCEHVRRLLAPWVDGAITPTDRARVDAHLSACSACATRASRERSARDVLQRRRPELLADTAPEGLRARIQADARRDRQAPAAGWRRVPISIAATLVLAFSGLTLHLATGRSTTLLAAQLAADHVKCHLLQRDEGAADPTEVQHRLAERYGFRARVPASSIEQRLRLVGARRCLTGEGTNAHILYRLDGRPLSLYLVPNESRPAVSVRVLGRDAVVWSRDNGTYVLVADGGASDLGRVARYMQRATE